jgi:hypothetical protein
MMNTINLAASHLLISSALRFYGLIPQNILRLCMELVCRLIEKFEVPTLHLGASPPAQVLGQDSLDECGPGLLGSSNPIYTPKDFS